MWDCAEINSAGPVRSKPADQPEHVRLPLLVYPVPTIKFKTFRIIVFNILFCCIEKKIHISEKETIGFNLGFLFGILQISAILNKLVQHLCAHLAILPLNRIVYDFTICFIFKR